MSPALLPTVRELVRRTTVVKAETIADTVLRVGTSAELLAYLTQQARDLWPEVALLDTREQIAETIA
jgi:hypothetical protein